MSAERLIAAASAAQARGNTALHFAVAYGFAALGDWLRRSGAQPALRNAAGRPAIEGIGPEGDFCCGSVQIRSVTRDDRLTIYCMVSKRRVHVASAAGTRRLACARVAAETSARDDDRNDTTTASPTIPSPRSSTMRRQLL